ncbi:DUF4468 domain-containing protein [Parabacteroides sp. 52]|uniref:DUF4468 domain-containing protein n=1 Tax=unclassified Parabacteroides TaxID=2649774 RepID=UPI0013D3D124|nr:MULTISPECIES: DUF4468 domain-containing protein [unclassified Parabacteroides]MDH6534414.1 hypothetical protein [Parabacteroides sp. PM5-20]NDV54913.1 DUF4468 domain-containing protein [Parabacteroides sp. 52]
MKRILLLLLILLPSYLQIQANNEETKTCAPMKGGKVCYSYNVKANNLSKARLYEAIQKWAAKTYGSDIFFSNVSSNKGKGSILISSKVELLLNETEKTFIKFRMRIQCYDDRCTIDITDITYQYDPEKDKRYNVYPAEEVIAENGKKNKVDLIKDPLLFCNATHYFAEGLMTEVVEAIKRR